MTVRVQDQGTDSTIAIAGSCTVADLEAVFGEVLKVETLPCKLLTIDLVGIETVDVALLQYLVALKNSFETRAQQVAFLPLTAEHPVLEVCQLLGLSLGVPEKNGSLL